MNRRVEDHPEADWETDPDIGYRFSQAFVVKTNSPAHRWVVIFGNGYESVANKAVLYVLDLYGNIVRKIESYNEELILRPCLHPRLNKPMTVPGLTLFIAEHDDHHLALISRILK